MKVLIAFAPPLVWLLYFREREGFSTSLRAVCLALLCGAAVTYLAYLLQNFLSNSPDISFRWFYELALVKALTMDGVNPRYAVEGMIYGGVIEESLKFLAVLAVFSSLRSSLRPAHLVIVGLAIGCGFEISENIVRYFSATDWSQVALDRSLTGNHVFYGVIMGSLLALGFMGRMSIAMFTSALIVPILLHGAHNHAISMNLIDRHSGTLWRVIFFAVEVATILLALGLTRYVARFGVESENTMQSAASSHPWLSHPRLRKWAWRVLALLVGLLGFLLIVWNAGDNPDTFTFGAMFLLGLLACTYAILFELRGRAAAKAQVV